MAFFIETVMPILLEEVARSEAVSLESFIQAFQLVAVSSSGLRPSIWLQCLHALDVEAWLELNHPLFEYREKLLHASLQVIHTFLQDDIPDGGCEILGHDEGDDALKHRCKALDFCCKV